MVHFKTYTEFISESMNYDDDFPIIKGDYIGDLYIRDKIPNMNSISSSLNDYKILNAIREVSFSKSFPDYEPHYYSMSDKNKTEKLIEEIRQNKEINPLIVVIDKEGTYVLEGGHRFDALKELDIDLFPAKIVLDLESLDELNEEYKQEDTSLLESLDDYFSIGFEIELDTDHRRINSLPIPPKIITNESKEMTFSISDRRRIIDIKSNFPNFFKKYYDSIKFHQDETVPKGIEIVSKPFNSIKESKDFLHLFFQEFVKQDKWFFTDKTSIHINIGARKRPRSREWKIVKGIIMLSDDYTFKNIETRKTSGYCNSLKNEIALLLKGKIKTNDIKEIENSINQQIEKIFKFTVKTYNMNLWKLFNKGYVEFRPVGGMLSEPIVIDKMMYFIYCVYLMTSSYKEQEYHNELLKFVETLD